MMYKLANGILAGVAAIALSGCGITLKPVTPDDLSVRPEYRAGADLAYTQATVSRALRTTPAHPADTFLSGNTTTGNPSGIDVALKAGAVVSVGGPGLRVYAGGDARYSVLADVSARKKREGDVRGDNNAAYAQTQLVPSYAAIPIVGIEAVIGEMTVRVEGGMPYASFKAESGDYRFDTFRPVQSARWAGWGKHLGIDARYSLAKDWRVGLSLGYEQFNAEFGGEKSDIKSFLGALQMEFKW